MFGLESDLRFGGVMEIKKLDYSNFGVQKWIKSELELEVFLGV